MEQNDVAADVWSILDIQECCSDALPYDVGRCFSFLSQQLRVMHNFLQEADHIHF